MSDRERSARTWVGGGEGHVSLEQARQRAFAEVVAAEELVTALEVELGDANDEALKARRRLDGVSSRLQAARQRHTGALDHLQYVMGREDR